MREWVWLNNRRLRAVRGVRGNSLVALGGYSRRQKSNNYPMSAHPPLVRLRSSRPPVQHTLPSSAQLSVFPSKLSIRKWLFRTKSSDDTLSLLIWQQTLHWLFHRFMKYFNICPLHLFMKIFLNIKYFSICFCRRSFPRENSKSQQIILENKTS